MLAVIMSCSIKLLTQRVFMAIDILLIEDDKEIARLTKQFLSTLGHNVSIAYDGEQGLAMLQNTSPDVVLLDLMLPKISGIEVCQQARSFYSGAIIVITAVATDAKEVSLLNLGADDFISKPIKPMVLMARIEALLRRKSQAHNALTATVEKSHGGYKFDTVARVLFIDGKKVTLSDSEMDLFLLLCKSINTPVSRQKCCESLRGINYDPNDRSIDMRISSLRRKLNDNKVPYQRLITVRNKGYMLREIKV